MCAMNVCQRVYTVGDKVCVVIVAQEIVHSGRWGVCDGCVQRDCTQWGMRSVCDDCVLRDCTQWKMRCVCVMIISSKIVH